LTYIGYTYIVTHNIGLSDVGSPSAFSASCIRNVWLYRYNHTLVTSSNH